MAITKSDLPSPPPPRRNSSSNTSAASKQAMAKIEIENSNRRQNRIDGLNSIASAGQMILLALKQPADAGAVNRHAPAISEAVVDYAEKSGAKWAESLDRLSDVSPVAGIAMAVIPLMLQVSVNHGLFGMKAEQLATAGIVTPETLISESNTYLMEVQTQAMQREMAAQREMQQTYNEFVQSQREAAETKATENDSGA